MQVINGFWALVLALALPWAPADRSPADVHRIVRDSALAQPEHLAGGAHETWQLAAAANDSERFVGPDNRIQVTSTKDFPFRTVGYIEVLLGSGAYDACTGFLVGPRTVLTAAHCLYAHEGGGWVKDAIFAPGINGPENVPFGASQYAEMYVPLGFIESYDGTYASVARWDLGLLIMRDPIGDELGWMAFGADPDLKDGQANLVGYPQDKPSGQMWRSQCAFHSDESISALWRHECIAFPGSDGSPLYVVDANQIRHVIGVHTAKTDDGYVALRLSPALVEWINAIGQ